MGYQVKHKPYKTNKFKCKGCYWSIGVCKDKKKESKRISQMKSTVKTELIHVDSKKCLHCKQGG